jgi:hypothetical protein
MLADIDTHTGVLGKSKIFNLTLENITFSSTDSSWETCEIARRLC